jgi:hypothetical protein
MFATMMAHYLNSRYLNTILIASFALLAGPGSAAEINHPPFNQMMGGCDNYKLNLKKELAAWDRFGQLESRAGLSARQAPEIKPGEKVRLLLSAKGVEIASPVPMDKQKMYDGRFGGFAKFLAPSSGSFRLSAGSKAWIDLLDSQVKPVDPSSFEMQKKCSKIFKVVVFDLRAGETYILQVLGSKSENLSILITK